MNMASQAQAMGLACPQAPCNTMLSTHSHAVSSQHPGPLTTHWCLPSWPHRHKQWGKQALEHPATPCSAHIKQQMHALRLKYCLLVCVFGCVCAHACVLVCLGVPTFEDDVDIASEELPYCTVNMWDFQWGSATVSRHLKEIFVVEQKVSRQ